MDNEELIETLRSKLFKAESDLKVKSANEVHLNYDNEYLLSQNEKLLEEALQSKESLEKLNLRIKKLTCDAEEVVFSKDEKETLEKEIQSLKDDLNAQIKKNKEMTKPVKLQTDSPDVRLRDKIYKYKSHIEELQENNSALLKKIDQQSFEMEIFKEEISKEVEILNYRIENYRQLLEAAKADKDEIENEYMTFQTDVNQPDFKRQGNSLYVEVNDRRILAEMKLLEFQNEIIRLRNTNKGLRLFLEGVFEEYRLITDEEHKNTRMRLTEQVVELTSEKRKLEALYESLNYFVKEKLDHNCTKDSDGSLLISYQIVQINKLKRTIETLETQALKLNKRLEIESKRADKLYSSNVKLFKENASHLTTIADLETKLACWDNIVPEEKKKEFEAKQKELEESVTACFDVEKTQGSLIPPEAFGQIYHVAKFKDILVFDICGRPIKNRLTRRVIEKYMPEKPEVEEIVPEPIVRTLYEDEMLNKAAREKDKKMTVMKENVDPNQESTPLEQSPDCHVS